MMVTFIFEQYKGKVHFPLYKPTENDKSAIKFSVIQEFVSWLLIADMKEYIFPPPRPLICCPVTSLAVLKKAPHPLMFHSYSNRQ